MRLDPHRLYEEIRARKIPRALAVYVGSGIPIIGIANLLESRYGIAHAWFDRLLILLGFGLLLTIVAAWYHGKPRARAVRRTELMIYGVLCVCAVAAILLIPGPSRPAKPPRATPEKSIAVLPFRNISGDPKDDYFSDGITEDILTHLSQIADLRVISRTTVMRYRASTKSVREIGDELSVGAILEGSVRREGARVRIVGQLIDVKSDEHLWAATYDRELRDIFAIQTEVAQNIASALQAVMTPREQERLGAAPTASMEAYALYLQGRQHYGRYTGEDNEKAIGLFRGALALDSAFALAYAGLSDAYSQRVQRYQYTMDWLDSASDAARTAIRLGPESAEGYKALGLALDNMGRASAALDQYEEAVSRNPNYALALRNMALLYYRSGRLDQALAATVRAVPLAPDEVIGYVQAGMTLQQLGLDSAALLWYARARRIDSGNPFPLLFRAGLHLMQSDLAAALRDADTLLALAPSLPPGLELRMMIGIRSGDFRAAHAAYVQSRTGPSASGVYILRSLGKAREARAEAEATLARCRRLLDDGSESTTPLWEMASTYAVLGLADSALVWSGQAIEAGWSDYRLTMGDPIFATLRSNQRFSRQMEAVKERVASMRPAVVPTPP